MSEQEDRGARVDAAMAGQLRESIQRNTRLKNRLSNLFVTGEIKDWKGAELKAAIEAIIVDKNP